MEAKTSREMDKFVLRLPDGKRAKYEVLAKIRNRSMNSEMLIALDKHLINSEAELEAYISELQAELSRMKGAPQ